jgi:hypothetical protein
MTCPGALHAGSISHRNPKPPAAQSGAPTDRFARDTSFFEGVSWSVLAAAERQVVRLPTKE